MLRLLLGGAAVLSIILVAVGAPVVTGWITADRAHAVETGKLDRFESPAEVAALRFHADWCGSCQLLTPKWNEALDRLEDGLIQAETVDLTFTLGDRRAVEKRKVVAMGGAAEEVFDAFSGGTGYVILFERRTGRELGRIYATMTVDQMVMRVKNAVNTMKTEEAGTLGAYRRGRS